MSRDLLRGLDPAWSAGEPARLIAQHPARAAELAALDPPLATLYERGAAVLAGARDAAELRERHVALLGRERGVVSLALAELPALTVEERRARGRALNLTKRWLTEIEEARRAQLERDAESKDALDVTLPGRKPWVGRPHVLAQIRDELLDLFHGLGYSVYLSPEVELDEYNFGKLNFPPDHPARDAHDTYFVNQQVVLRTHTSPGWVRAMEERKPPLRLVFPGRVYRAEQVDASHMDQFHQMDGLCVDRDVSMADLKATLNTFARSILGREVTTRLIPIYFPFVEPGCQLDVACAICGGGGRVRGGEGEARCPVCKGAGWSELLGAGMVHPNVFRAVGYDPEEVTGFAFGMGLERIAMARYGIPEIRLFLENDLRFLGQF
ncbi:MAG: phenylalanine--tRNA ligase subunit alpha [Candidatus Eisenbacteria bacterium]|nr:phenylalanine--tRNA ligase subunit alpha [Candidatus Eisenbacteria bacterium]